LSHSLNIYYEELWDLRVKVENEFKVLLLAGDLHDLDDLADLLSDLLHMLVLLELSVLNQVQV
jgi:hypothetical protein